MKNTMYGFCALAFLISTPLVLGGCGGGGTMPITNGGGGKNVKKFLFHVLLSELCGAVAPVGLLTLNRAN
jgi:hypothetical protein